MLPTKAPQQDETDFMQSILDGLDDAFSANQPLTPAKSKKPAKVERVLERMKTPNKTPKKTKAEGVPSADGTAGQIPVSQHDIDMVALLAGAEDWDWDDMNDFMTPKKASPKKPISTPGLGSPKKPLPGVPKREYQKAICTRCFVESVSEFDVRGRSQKKLIIRVEPGEERHSIILQDDWVATDVRIGDTINVIGPFETLPSSSSSLTSTIHVTSKSNYIILHPDILITATALSNASQCTRKPLLSSLVRSTSDTTPALVWGNILHQVMQLCMNESCWEEKWIEERIDEIVRKNLVYIVQIEMTVEDALREIKTRAKGLIAFARKYLGEAPKLEGALTDTRSSPSDPQSLLAITNLLDVEEDIWSPTYGLKGKIDATVHSVVSQPKVPSSQINHYFPKSKEMEMVSGAVPFEIKTGRSTAGMEHRAQTMLYTLLVAERYHQEVDAGLLYYTQREEVVRVPVVRNELRGLMLVRNELAGYMMRRNGTTKLNRGDEGRARGDEEPFLPPTVDDERACKRCYVLNTCMLYRKAVEGVIDTTSPIADTYDLRTSHLTQHQLEFFKKWERLISLEEKDIHRFKKELWTMGSQEREEKGRCFSMMVLDTTYDPRVSPPSSVRSTYQVQVDNTEADLVNTGKDKIHKFTYRFIRSSQMRLKTQISQGKKVEVEFESLLNGHMSVGEPITISVEPDLFALARGFIVDLMPREVVVGVDHELDLKKIGWSLETRRRRRQQTGEEGKQVVFRIDKDDLSSGMARIRGNLAQMFYAEGDTKRLELVVDLRRPVFGDLNWAADGIRVQAPSQEQKEFTLHTQHLNINQKAAVKKALSANDYALILGMPGTGKTSVIASLVKVLVGLGKTVLLSAYTHSAVDNVLLRLEELGEVGFGVLRLGNLDKIHPDVQKFTLARRKQATTIEQLEMQLMSPPVVATTCLSVDHALFGRRKFDYCIVDEASQITLPTCLGPLRFAEKFVLVGDHFQLPPLIRSVQARQEGLDISLFRRLSDAHPEAVVELAEQYRMNEDIMTLSNRLIYGDRLRCGSESVRTRGLVLTRKEVVESLCERGGRACGGAEGGCWMRRLLDENCKAVFVDTDHIPAHESRAGDLIQNELEAELVRQVAEVLLESGVSAEQIGIITLYRQQVKLISHLLGGRKDLEILTADRSQGRDKDCVIFSMVRSNEENRTGDLVKDWRRMNVSFTRARSKLIIFGSRKTLQAAPLLKEFFNLMDEKGWVLKMPSGSHSSHTAVGGGPVLVPGMDGSASGSQESKLTPSKRSGKKENVSDGGDVDVRPVKKMRKSADVGILKGKPLLQDLINDGL